MADWVQLTVSDGHFLDEITAALREARIELRLSEPVAAGAVGVRTRFGAQGPEAKVIEVPRESLAEAQALLNEIYDGAEAAALREAGVPAPTAAEREEEEAWLAARRRKQARADAIFRGITRALAGLFLAAFAVGVVIVLFSLVRGCLP